MIRITTDSACNLAEYIQNRDISVLPLDVVMGDVVFAGGEKIDPHRLFALCEKKNVFPEISTPSVEEYRAFFEKHAGKENTVVHVNGFSGNAAAYEHARTAAAAFGERVFVINSDAFTDGQGLLAVKAADFRDRGMCAEEIVSKLNVAASKIVSAFVLDNREYLHKRGKCSRMRLGLSQMLHTHPLICMTEGELLEMKKYFGSLKKCVARYVERLAAKYAEYDNSRCIVAHTATDAGLLGLIGEQLDKKFSFKEVILTDADPYIAGHCGKNAVGILFIGE